MNKYKQQNEQFASSHPMKGPRGGGGIAPGNQSSLDNPLIMPDSYARNRQAEQHNKAYVGNHSIVKPQGGGGGIRPGNDTSLGNPLNNYDPRELDHYAAMNKNAAPLAAQKNRTGGGIQAGNHTSGDNPMNTHNYPKYGQKEYYYEDDNIGNAESQMQRQAGMMNNPNSRGGGFGARDPYEGLTPKQRLEQKKREHYMQGSMPSGGGAPVGPKGGLSQSNETSLANPLSTYDPRMLEHYRQENQQRVAMDPIKNGRQGANKNWGGGGMGGGIGGMGGQKKGGNMGGGGGMGGGNMGGGGGDDGYVRKKGGMAMNL